MKKKVLQFTFLDHGGSAANAQKWHAPPAVRRFSAGEEVAPIWLSTLTQRESDGTHYVQCVVLSATMTPQIQLKLTVATSHSQVQNTGCSRLKACRTYIMWATGPREAAEQKEGAQSHKLCWQWHGGRSASKTTAIKGCKKNLLMENQSRIQQSHMHTCKREAKYQYGKLGFIL